MTIKEFAALCACSSQTLRYYDNISLNDSDEPERDFSPDDCAYSRLRNNRIIYFQLHHSTGTQGDCHCV